MQKRSGVTPKGESAYSKWLYEIDDRFGGDKFIGTLKLVKNEENDAFVKEIIERHRECGGPDGYCPAQDGDVKEKKANEWDVKNKHAKKVGEVIKDPQFEGAWVLKFKSKHAPKIFDAFKREVKRQDAEIMPGDIVRFAFSDNPMDDPKKHIRGCYLYLNKVQLVEKRATAGSAGADEFGVVEGGFEVPEATATDEADF
jgi:hypothetical protein